MPNRSLTSTILAVMSYQTTPWKELAKKPSIRKPLKYIAVRGSSHYDEIEALTKELMRKHFDGNYSAIDIVTNNSFKESWMLY